MKRSPTIIVLAAALAACGGPPAAVPNEGRLSFDGRGGRVALGTIGPKSPLQLGRSRFTISAWILQAEGGDPYQRIIDKSDGPVGHDGWALGADGGPGQIHLYAHDGTRGADFCSSRGAYTTGTWHHVVALARSKRYELWIDGKRDRGAFFEDGAFVLPSRRAAPASIGNWNHEPGRAWKGLLDEVAVWNTALSPAEIEEVRASRGTLDLTRNGGAYRSARHLVGWWRMEPGSVRDSTILVDSSSSRADGRLEPGGAGGEPPVVTQRGGP